MKTLTLTEDQAALLANQLFLRVRANKLARDYFAAEASRYEYVFFNPVESKSMQEIVGVYNALIHDDLEVLRDMDRHSWWKGEVVIRLSTARSDTGQPYH